MLISLPFVAIADEMPAIPSLDERVREMVLDNGLRVVVVERHAAPVFFTLTSFRVGSSQELPDRSGLSHFLEHMLFKGTETLGTTNLRKEREVIAKLEKVAADIKQTEVALGSWRFEKFDAYATKVKSELPPEIREAAGSDQATGWRETLKRLPTNNDELPAEWLEYSWILKDRKHDYWQMYRDLLANRIRITELIAEQRKYMVGGEPLSDIYEVNGSKSLNAFTTPDQTTYMVGLPANCLELWMFLESDRFKNPVFRDFYSEREVIMEELRMGENDPGNMLYRTLMQSAFAAHPYGRSVGGWRSDVRTTLRSDMEEHFRKYYAPNNCQLTIVGDVDVQQVFKLANQYFGPWKASEVAEVVKVIEPEQPGEQRTTVEWDAEPRLMIGYHIPVAPHPDAYALTMMDFILSYGRTSRFYKTIFEERGLTASAPGIFTAPADRYPNLFAISATPKAPHGTEEVEAAIYAEIDRLKSELVSDPELERVRNSFRMWQLDRLRSNRWLAFTLSSAYIDRGDWRTIDEDFGRLMEVTAEDIQRVAQKYFIANNRTVATLVKKAAAQETALDAEMGG